MCLKLKRTGTRIQHNIAIQIYNFLYIHKNNCLQFDRFIKLAIKGVTPTACLSFSNTTVTNNRQKILRYFQTSISIPSFKLLLFRILSLLHVLWTFLSAIVTKLKASITSKKMLGSTIYIQMKILFQLVMQKIKAIRPIEYFLSKN